MKQKIKRYIRIFEGVKIPWPLILFVVILAMVTSYVEVGTVTLQASIIDAGQKTVDTKELFRYIFYLVASGVLSISSSYIGGLAYEKVNMGVRLKLWGKIMRLPVRYYDGDDGNELVTRVTMDANYSKFYFQLAIDIFASLYAMLVAYHKMFQFNRELAVWVLSVIPLTLAFGILYGKMNYYAGKLEQNRIASMMAYLAEHVRNFRLIKSFCTEDEELKKSEGKFKKVFWAEMLSNLSVALQVCGIELVTCVCMIISFVAGGRLVNQGVLTTGKLVGFYNLAVLVALRVSQLYIYWGSFKKNNGVMQKIATVLETEEESQEGQEFDVEDEDICLENVTFSYNGPAVLKDISCRIPKGKVTAIVGFNGAGKTTLFKLLERMYVPGEGRVTMGGRNIEEFNLHSWRKSFAIVDQEKPLISGTVRENIIYGVERKVSEEELTAVAKMANVYDFVMATPEGFDAQVGPGGSNFSGGQQQCIAIARAMMRNADYLLLDEATSNLDVKSERIVTNALDKLMEGRTTVMIAHSYAATKDADYIIVMNAGGVDGAGTPEEMLRSNRYYQMFAQGQKKAGKE